MKEVPGSNTQSNPTLKNLALTGIIASLFIIPPTSSAQEYKKQVFNPPEATKDPTILYTLPKKDINVVYPGRESYFLPFVHIQDNIPTSIQKEINTTKKQFSPLSLAESKVGKYFPEREAVFKEIIATIKQNPVLAHQINHILNQTVMKPTRTHKEIHPRPSTERDKVCATLMFIEQSMNQTIFTREIDKRDHIDELYNEFGTTTIDYETRLAITDEWIMPGEMIERIFQADKLFRDWETAQQVLFH